MPVITRQTASLLAVVGLGLGVAACSQSAAQDMPKAAPAAVVITPDISRIDAVAGAFPTGFEVNTGLSKTLTRSDVENAGMDALTRGTLSPGHCLPMIVPSYAHPKVGTEVAGVTGSGELGGVQVTALRTIEAFSAAAAPEGCEKVVISGSDTASGTAERVPAPEIAGVTTTGVKLIEDGPDQPAHYIFTAALDEHTVVVVRSSLDEQLQPHQFLSNLLVQATTAVRGW